jgi:hypothetical protein
VTPARLAPAGPLWASYPSAPMRALALPLALTLAACSDPAPAATPARDAAVDAPADAPADAAADDAGDPCASRPADRGPTSVCVRRVEGRVTDLDGAPLAGRPITVCGPACFLAITAADGSFRVEVGDWIDVAIYSVHAHGRPDYASVYVPLAAPLADVARLPEAMALPRYDAPGPELPDGAAGGTVSAGGVTLTIAPGTRLELDLEDVDLGPLGRRLRVAPVPVERAPAALVEAAPAALYALAPFALIASRPIGVTLPNRAGLAPGTAVEFIALGVEPFTPPINAGSAVVAALGRVSDDGATVTTAPEEGLRTLSWIGYRPRSP